MLVYHPMFDPHHCALRLLSISIDSGLANMEWDRLRILDFFVTFPHLLKTVRLPTEFRSVKTVFKSLPAPYESLPSPAKLFFQLGGIQDPAARVLAASGFFDRDEFVRGVMQVVRTAAIAGIEHLTTQLSHRSSVWYSFITKEFSRFPLNGVNGLKDRSGLLEFRHDPV